VRRLKSRQQFLKVLDRPTKVKTSHFVLHDLPLADLFQNDKSIAVGQVKQLFVPDGSWIGAVVPKRHARRATTRNAIKRQIFLVSDQFGQVLPAAAYVVRLRKMFDKVKFFSASSNLLKKTVHHEIFELFNQVNQVSRDSTK
jgi:ribonuclease P protein component